MPTAVHAPEVYRALQRAVSDLAARATELSLDLHAHPETAFEEHRAAERLSGWLADEGFRVERGVAGLGTAFVAEWGQGRPRVAILLEYDALPKLGHGCGHNLIAAGGITAATAVRRVLAEDCPGTLTVIGTPGEEGGGGKVIELEAGVFDEVDAALMFHPADRTIPWRRALACVHLRVRFHGVAAHAAKNPEQGRNALAAMIQLFVAIDGLRQHIEPNARVHGVIRNGGDAPNVVPDLTEAEILVRHDHSEGALALARRVRACAEAAALATGTTAAVDEPTPRYAERKNNLVIARRLAAHMTELGIDVQEARAADPAGSSDIGNISTVLPCVHPYVQIAPRDTSSHSVPMREAAASPQAQQVMVRMAEALARTGFDLLADPGVLEAARAEFAARPDADAAA